MSESHDIDILRRSVLKRLYGFYEATVNPLKTVDETSLMNHDTASTFRVAESRNQINERNDIRGPLVRRRVVHVISRKNTIMIPIW